MTGPVRLADRAFTPDEARVIAAWAYDPPFDVYDLSRDDAVALLLARDERGHGYYPVLEGDDVVVGFVCFGAEARVSGQDEHIGTCDVGAGLDPERLSEGIATALMPAAVRFAVDRFGAHLVRAVVQRSTTARCDCAPPPGSGGCAISWAQVVGHSSS